MALEEYRRKRNFRRTPEPRGRKAAPRTGQPLTFVIQKHAASRLHYDFRLELGGTLKSWAVPKGPSLDPAERRLAVLVEDHPLEYAGFEGVIPPGQYGGGTVLLWDRGHWISEGDPAAGFRRGTLRFHLEGAKLQGGWHLVRMHGSTDGDSRDNWLLIKNRDEYARTGSDGDVVAAQPESVASGRTIEQIAADADRVWDSAVGEVPSASRGRAAVAARRRTHGAAVPAAERAAARHAAAPGLDPRLLTGARHRAIPSDIQPQLATLVAAAPVGDAWLHEIKFDGYRLLCRLDGSGVRILSRNGKDWTPRFPGIARAVTSLPARQLLLDGEAVVLEGSGRTNFQALQNALAGESDQIVTYFAFDLLYIDGFDLTAAPLDQRKRVLANVLGAPDHGRGQAPSTGSPGASPIIRYSEHIQGNGPRVHKHACRLGAEGIVSKLASAPYRPGRSRDWLKTKCFARQEFVIIGWTDPEGSRTGLGSLLLGYYEDSTLRYAGRVGTGFTARSLTELRRRLGPLARKTPPVRPTPPGTSGRGVHWAKPNLVAEVAFTEWTRDGMLRHPSFKGLREDRDPREVRRERESPARPVKAGPGNASGAAPEAVAEPAVRPRSRPPAARTTGTTRAASGPGKTITVAGVRLSSPDRVYYPDVGVTKLELVRYYEAVAERMLPHVTGRPLTLVRCPDGHAEGCFFQKHVDDSYPDYIRRLEIRETKATRTYFTADSLKAIIYLVQTGTLEFHVWGSRRDRLERPDRLVFDLDPGQGVSWPEVVKGAFTVRDFLSELGLASFIKTTGGSGLHVVAPIVRRTSWEELKSFAGAVAAAIARAAPDRYTDSASLKKRKGRIYVDHLRNARGSTAVVAYSTRARSGATVSTPLDWEELTPELRPDALTVRTLPDRINRLRHDPWAALLKTRQAITAQMKKNLGLG